MIRFATTNEGKLREARDYLGEVEQFDYDYEEIQADTLEPIAARGAREAFEAAGGADPVMVDDSGLFIDDLGGFPGPYSSYVYDALGIDRVSTLSRAEDDTRAHFRCVIAYCDGDEVRTFEGAVRGRIVEARGEGGFGYDPIFEHNGRTFAEMAPEEKNALSHRGRALAKLGSWLAGESVERRGAK